MGVEHIFTRAETFYHCNLVSIVTTTRAKNIISLPNSRVERCFTALDHQMSRNIVFIHEGILEHHFYRRLDMIEPDGLNQEYAHKIAKNPSELLDYFKVGICLLSKGALTRKGLPQREKLPT